jgi:hypothetical protein
MELEHVQRAVEALQAQGVPLEAITAPKVREILGSGSYTTITAHLRVIRGESAGGLDDLSEGGEPDAEALSPPGDPVCEAEQALASAQASLQAKMDVLPGVEAAMAEARSRVIAALGAKLAVLEGYKLAIFSGDEQARAHVESECADATQAYGTARLALKQAMDAIAGWGQRVREAEQRVKEATRQRFLAKHHPDLVAELMEALELQDRDPWLQPQSDQRSVQAAQAKYKHQYRLDDIRQRMKAACEAAGL